MRGRALSAPRGPLLSPDAGGTQAPPQDQTPLDKSRNTDTQTVLTRLL